MENIKIFSLLLCFCVSANAIDKRCSYAPFAGEVESTDENATIAFSYNREDNECYSFNYGGTRINFNHFKSNEECEKACRDEDPCNQPPFTGSDPVELDCRTSTTAWTYYVDENRCIHYQYYCGGNKNIFNTQEQCLSLCKRDPCSYKPYSGSLLDEENKFCSHDIKRYTYVDEKKGCVEYSYGGCSANFNSFETLDECKKTCEY